MYCILPTARRRRPDRASRCFRAAPHTEVRSLLEHRRAPRSTLTIFVSAFMVCMCRLTPPLNLCLADLPAPKQLLDGVTHANDVWWTGKQGIVATQYATSDDEDLGTLVLTNPGAVASPFCASSYNSTPLCQLLGDSCLCILPIDYIITGADSDSDSDSLRGRECL